MTRIGKKRVFNNDLDSEEDSSCNARSDSDREDDSDSDYDPKAGRPVRAVSHSSVKKGRVIFGFDASYRHRRSVSSQRQHPKLERKPQFHFLPRISYQSKLRRVTDVSVFVKDNSTFNSRLT